MAQGLRHTGIGLLALVSGFSAAQAAMETSTLTVSATVQTECALNGGTLDFGTYISGQGNDLNATGEIAYANCSGLLRFELDGGQSSSTSSRFMAFDGDQLAYQLYQTPSRISVWGQGEEDLQLLLAPTTGSVTVYGTIPGGQLVKSGIYTDIVNITLTF